MNIKWTDDQQRVIDSRDKNLIVSAAAGSGKTAVLVERILSIVSDPDHPVDIDSLLIVTFTRAAAGEMKERLRARFERLSADNPSDEHLRRQSVLIHNARISTIHGFCTNVIKNYFYRISLDPVFRIMEETEAKLLKRECAKTVIEEALLKTANDDSVLNSDTLLEFSASHLSGKKTAQLEDLIISLYEKIIADPWPYEWLDEAVNRWKLETENDIEKLGITEELNRETEEILEEVRLRAEENVAAALRPEGPSAYLPAVESDLKYVKEICDGTDREERLRIIKDIKYARLSSAKAQPGEDPSLREKIKASRQLIKKDIEQILKLSGHADTAEILEEASLCSVHAETLCALIRSFMKRYYTEKRDKNLMDYPDLEHFALAILVTRDEEGNCIPTEAAKEIASGFIQVMTDEYQDSNDVQELILQSVSGGSGKYGNRFMVGDIKQSIYGFRHARPDIFIGKYESYKTDESCEAVDLHDNYRSRSQVIGTANYIFRKLMSKRLGGVEYDDSQALYSKAAFPEDRISGNSDPYITEIILADAKEEALVSGSDKTQLIEAEALIAAAKIKEFKDKMLVYDRKQDKYRKLRYSDCAVLLRTTRGYSDVFYRVFQMKGIPAQTDSGEGYFDTVEVKTVINYLKILDNPLQEVPFTAVLFSYITDISSEQLAMIRSSSDENELYNAARYFAEHGDDPDTKEKLRKFFKQYDELRKESGHLSVQKLLRKLYAMTGIRNIVSAMPAGLQRAANLDMLVIQAAEYEKTSYHGLFNFVRYIEEIEKSKQDMGAANLDTEGSDAVNIMTIHKSKGLEFPVIILSGCGHGFNKTDTRKSILMHKDLGIGLDAVDPERRIKKTTLFKSLMIKRMTEELLSEELRLLYVAVTRAKEKLVITGVHKNLSKATAALEEEGHLYRRRIPEKIAFGADCYLDWILPCFADQSTFSSVLEWNGSRDSRRGDLLSDEDLVRFSVVSAYELLEKEIESELTAEMNAARLSFESGPGDEDIRKRLDDIRSFKYPFGDLFDMPQKVSVSELKSRREDSVIDEESRLMNTPYLTNKKIPGFISEEEPDKGGAARGSAYHKFLRYVDYAALRDNDDSIISDPEMTEVVLIKEKERMLENSLITKEEADFIDPRYLLSFFCSDTALRINTADREGLLYREQPFTLGISASMIDKDWPSGETVIIQGMIDVFFCEDDGYVVVDYKTDRVPDMNTLKERYKAQLDLYGEAVAKSTGRPVKEKIIYSLYRNDIIII